MITKNTLGPHHCPSCGNQCDSFKDLDEQDYCNDCRPADKLAETLEQFRNGAERYDNDPTFKQAIDSLVAGVGVYAVLDSVLRRLSHQQEVNRELKHIINGIK